MQKVQKIEISVKTIIFTIIFLIVLRFFWLMKDLLFSLFIAFIVMSAVKPAVNFFEKKGVPRQLATILFFGLALSLFIWLLSLIFPPLVNETAHFIKYLPTMIESLNPAWLNYVNLSSLTQYIPNITNHTFNLIKTIVSNAIFLTTTIFFSIYLTMDDKFIKKVLIRFLPEEKTNRIVLVFDKIEKRMSAWLWGEFILMLVVGTMTFIGLNLIGVKYALSLAIIAGFLEVIPNLGPIVSTIPAFLIALTQSYFLGFSTIALYFVVQQLENNLIVPLVMKTAVGLNPIITVVMMIVGGRVGGILGVLLAIPTTLFIETIVIELLNNKRNSALE